MYRLIYESEFENINTLMFRTINSLQIPIAMPNGNLNMLRIVAVIVDVEHELVIKVGTRRVPMNCGPLVFVLLTLHCD